MMFLPEAGGGAMESSPEVEGGAMESSSQAEGGVMESLPRNHKVHTSLS